MSTKMYRTERKDFFSESDGDGRHDVKNPVHDEARSIYRGWTSTSESRPAFLPRTGFRICPAGLVRCEGARLLSVVLDRSRTWKIGGDAVVRHAGQTLSRSMVLESISQGATIKLRQRASGRHLEGYDCVETSASLQPDRSGLCSHASRRMNGSSSRTVKLSGTRRRFWTRNRVSSPMYTSR